MKRVLLLLSLLFSIVSIGQGNQLWGSYYSYNNVQDITESNNRVFAASESAMFTKNVATNEIKTITSVDGLKAETITAIHHSPTYGKTLVGNANGLLLVVNNDFSVLNRIAIVQETTIPAAKKKINHIYEYEGKAYISCDFGIAVFNLATLEFGDTYYLGPSGAEISVRQATIYNGYMYAATNESGLRRATFPNPNLNDFSQWTQVFGGAWSAALTYSGSFFGFANGTLYKPDLQNNIPYGFDVFPSEMVDLREANGYMVATCSNRINVYNDALVRVFQLNLIPGENVTFTCATIVGGDIFIGTKEKGVFSIPMTNLSAVTNITPDGPLMSSIFSLDKTPNNLWAVYGGYSATYNPFPLKYYGISKFSSTGWTHIPNDDLFDAASISDIIANPNNENIVFAASFHDGLIKIENDVPVAIYDESPAIPNGPEPISSSDISVRINSLAFDKSGNLWMTNSLAHNAIKRYSPGNDQWASFNIFEAIGADNFAKMAIDRNNTKWIPTNHNGVLAFNENLNNKSIIIKGQENLPNDNVKCVAIDNNNRLWIGTITGLRVVSSIERFMTEDELTANPIIILEDGLAQELMYEQTITDIVVDGANNKWIGTAGAGAFLVTPDGQGTLFHFTKENSPLPSNNINDIEIDSATGEVFFATDRGMVSYKGTSTAAAGDLSKVYVFPNPVRPNFDGDVNISGLVDKANIKITDIEGNLVYETTSEGGTVLWDTRAFGKYKVATGVYMIFISSEDGTETKVKKVMIIRGE
ncbi:ABC transporter substrate-binding protein [Flavobacterium album]|uniref:ABC transporter substrate-binding protein n=1 Tax=Flavobacterium album TaxID=2175091 RepID=A0A2S1QVY5_9FLAO|nr:two-component regulator propeller domain-containing protein [Flavobacterium album]AWH84587.1 ABC transporter substrate-binding protein [Flavobacterium album]